MRPIAWTQASFSQIGLSIFNGKALKMVI